MSSVIDQIYGNAKIENFLPLLPLEPNDSELAAGFDIRARFVALFHANPPARPFFVVKFNSDPEGVERANLLQSCCTKTIDQNAHQWDKVKKRLNGQQGIWIPDIRGTLVGRKAATKRPFCTVSF